jgi:hypothetical protein
MSAATLLATCARLGVALTVEGESIRVRGPAHVRDQLLPEIRRLKPELRKVLHQAGCPGPTWQKDWRGRWVDLAGLRPGEDGRPPIFTAPKPVGVQ